MVRPIVVHQPGAGGLPAPVIGDVVRVGSRLDDAIDGGEREVGPQDSGHLGRGVPRPVVPRLEVGERDAKGFPAPLLSSFSAYRGKTGGASGIASPSCLGSEAPKCTPSAFDMTA